MSLSTNLLSYGWKLLVLLLIVKGVGTLVRRKLVHHLTVIDDLPNLGVQREKSKRIKGTVVICGGSLSGLLAARVCSDHFEDVIIVEPEEWLLSEAGLNPDLREVLGEKTINNRRARVPQWYINQGYHSTVYFVLSRLFPNDLEREVSQANGRITPIQFLAHLAGRRLPLVPDNYQKTIHLHRSSLEGLIRRLVLRISNVKQMSGRVIGLLGDQNRLSGIKMRTSDGSEEIVPATLVVDCSGLSTGGYQWIQDLLGSKTPEAKQFASLKQTFNNKFAYTTCYFQVSEALLEEMDKAGIPRVKDRVLGTLFLPNLHTDTRALYHWSYEKDILAITCSGYDMRENINDIDDIRQFCDNMVTDIPLPEWTYKVLDILQTNNIPFSKYTIRTPHPVYIQYAKAKHLPSNFIAVGDAVMQVNAYKGQGIAKASTDIVTLNKLLLKTNQNSIPDTFAKTFFKWQATRTGSIWESYKSEDYTVETTVPVTGEDRRKVGTGIRKYMDQVWPVAYEDSGVVAMLFDIMSWTGPASDLFSPTLLRKIATHKIRALL